MRHPFLLPLLLILVAAGPSIAQKNRLDLGDECYGRFAFVEAIDHYEQAFAQGAKSIEHARRLADAHWNLRQAGSAERWYAMVAASPEAGPEDLYRYAEVLRANGRFAESDMWLERFAIAAPNDSRGRRKADAEHRLGELLGSPGFSQRIVPAPFNSPQADLGPFIQGRQLYFASARIPDLSTRRRQAWDGQPYLDLFSATIDAQRRVQDVKRMGDDINSPYHESHAVISRDGQELWFTRNNHRSGENLLADGTNNVDLFVRRRTADGWGDERPFAHNDPKHSTGHPALSADGKRLYFTSDRPGGYGGKDLYRCERKSDGGWAPPENLGAAVNTEGDEMFPFVKDSLLFFASDGHLGLGGLDIFKVEVHGTAFGEVENLSAPINSAFDDHGLCLDDSGQWGMLVSDRPGGKGSDDIYFFNVGSEERTYKWVGRVVDRTDTMPIAYLPVRLLDLARNELARTVTSKNGVYEFTAPNVPATVVAEVPGGETGELPSEEITIAPFDDTQLQDIRLNAVMDLPVNALIRDARTDEALAGVRITVVDERDGKVLLSGSTDSLGVLKGTIPDRRFGTDQQLLVTFEKDGYLRRSEQVDLRVLMFLEQALFGPDGARMNAMELGLDIGKAMNLRPIYFDYDSDRLRSDAAGELDLVAQAMRVYPSMRIELRSHTDSRASARYNQQLSQRRSDAARAYLISEGIDPDRVTALGLGESRLVNRCSDGVACSELEHQENRRTEFIIVGADGMSLR